MEKPKVKLIGEDGNVFNLIGLASKALKKEKLYPEANDMVKKCFTAKSYAEALSIISDYVQIY